MQMSSPGLLSGKNMELPKLLVRFIFMSKMLGILIGPCSLLEVELLSYSEFHPSSLCYSILTPLLIPLRLTLHQSLPLSCISHLFFLVGVFLETHKCAQVFLTPLSDCSIYLHHSLVTAATSSPPTPSAILVQSGSHPHFSMETALLISVAAAPSPDWMCSWPIGGTKKG